MLIMPRVVPGALRRRQTSWPTRRPRLCTKDARDAPGQQKLARGGSLCNSRVVDILPEIIVSTSGYADAPAGRQTLAPVRNSMRRPRMGSLDCPEHRWREACPPTFTHSMLKQNKPDKLYPPTCRHKDYTSHCDLDQARRSNIVCTCLAA